MSQHESILELAEREGRALTTELAVTSRVRDGLFAPVGRRRGNRRRMSLAAIAEALDMTGEAVYFATPDLRIVETNSAAIGTTGFSRQRLTRMNLREVISDECEGQLRSNVARLIRREVAETSHMARQLCQDREAFAVRVRMRLVEQCDTTVVVVLVERQGELDGSLVAESRRDFLTGLPSREALEVRLQRAQRRALKENGRFVVLFVDLDDFKQINDAHGHRVGDQVLRIVAERLLGCMRPATLSAVMAATNSWSSSTTWAPKRKSNGSPSEFAAKWPLPSTSPGACCASRRASAAPWATPDRQSNRSSTRPIKTCIE